MSTNVVCRPCSWFVHRGSFCSQIQHAFFLHYLPVLTCGGVDAISSLPSSIRFTRDTPAPVGFLTILLGARVEAIRKISIGQFPYLEYAPPLKSALRRERTCTRPKAKQAPEADYVYRTIYSCLVACRRHSGIDGTVTL